MDDNRSDKSDTLPGGRPVTTKSGRMRPTLPSGNPLPPGCTVKDGRFYAVIKNKWHGLSRVDDGDVDFWLAYYRLTRADPHTMAGILIAFIDEGMGELAEETREKYKDYIVSRLIPACGHFHRRDFNSSHVAQYLEARKKGGAPVAGNRERACLSSACEFAMRQGWLKLNPCRGVRRNRERPAKVYVEHKALTAAIDKAPFALANLIAVAYLWGARQTDLRNLTWAQIPPPESQEAYVHIDESKTRKERDHEITPTVRFFLERASQHREAVAAQHEKRGRLEKAAAARAQPYVFLTARGLPWGKWALQSAMRRLEVDFAFRALRPKAETDKPGILGHTGQMQRRYTRRQKLRAVK